MTFNEIKIGQKEKVTHLLTEDDVNKFVELTGDNNKIHTSREFAKTTSFHKPVVHGMLGASFISTVIGTKLPGDGALWRSQNLAFILPVRIGDEITVVATVVEKNEREQSVRLLTEIYNQKGMVVTKGDAMVNIVKHINTDKPKKYVPSVVLILGATGGIGSEICRQLDEDGFSTVIHYYKNEQLALDIMQKSRNSSYIVSGDMNKDIPAIITEAMSAFGTIDVVVNCVSLLLSDTPFIKTAWNDDFAPQLNTHLLSNYYLSQQVIPNMVTQGYGKIIFIGSSIVDNPIGHLSAYITSKCALWGLTKSLSCEFAPKGIRVNMITPTLIETAMTADIPEKNKMVMASQTPLRRNAYATDVADMVSFLASNKSDYITGQNIRLNGGVYG